MAECGLFVGYGLQETKTPRKYKKESFPTFFNGAYKKRGASFVMWLGLLMDGVAQGRSNPI
jgi:hypothetical protein